MRERNTYTCYFLFSVVKIHIHGGHGETQRNTLNPEDLVYVYDYKSDDDNDVHYLTGNRNIFLFLLLYRK